MHHATLGGAMRLLRLGGMEERVPCGAVSQVGASSCPSPLLHPHVTPGSTCYAGSIPGACRH